MPDGTYAPQSPDLSSFLTSSSPQKKAPTSSYAPKSPNLSAFPTTATSPFRVQQPQGLGLNPSYHPAQQPQYQSYNEYNEYNQNPQSYLSPIPPLPPSHAFPQQQQHQLQDPYNTQRFGPDPQFTSQPPTDSQGQAGYTFAFPLSTPGQPDMATRGKRGAGKSENGTSSGPSRDLGPSKGIEIKTKFPVARIKRIMQADEEVGKVAQVTPVAVSKALELFMIALVTRSAEIAKSSLSKRVTAQHLKRAIEGEEQFDFLNDIVSRVAEGPDAGGKRVKSEDDSEDEDMEKGAGGRAAKKAKGRRKKGE